MLLLSLVMRIVDEGNEAEKWGNYVVVRCGIGGIEYMSFPLQKALEWL